LLRDTTDRQDEGMSAMTPEGQNPDPTDTPGSDTLLQLILGVFLAAAFCGLAWLKISAR
jgi:hypothetical protein